MREAFFNHAYQNKIIATSIIHHDHIFPLLVYKVLIDWGDAPLVGFSPRKARISLYLAYESEVRENLLENLGEHTTNKVIAIVLNPILSGENYLFLV